MACVDYEQVWFTMNELDETVQRVKIINDMIDNLSSSVYCASDDDELFEAVDTIKGFSKYIIRELESKSISAWNSTVVPLNPRHRDGVVTFDLIEGGK
mgnify:FL=1|tara:strand:- start:288 stop:581 length:294 start_codon:yes stop_codon:yes gene_type:complete